MTNTSISLETLFHWTIKDIRKLIIAFVFFAVIAVVYALSLPNIYASKAVVMSNMSDSGSLPGGLGQLGGLASLAGVNLQGSGINAEILNEMLNSDSFLADFIRKHDLAITIMTAEKYNPANDSFFYKDDAYDFQTKTWIREVDYPLSKEPSDAELVHKFKQYYATSYDRKTKLITISFRFFSARFSQQIVESIVKDFNDYMRQSDIRDYSDSLTELQRELHQAKLSEIRTSLQVIMEEQLKKLTFAKTRDQYALRTIESPQAAIQKTGPNRPLICIFITAIGVFLVALLLWTRRALKSQ